MNFKEKVLETLKNSDKALKGAELAQATGIEKKEVDKAIKTLLKEEKIFSPKRCFYEAN